MTGEDTHGRASRPRRRRSRGRGALLSLIVAVLRRLTASWWTVDTLAEDLNVSRRTILRILRAIRQEGLPLESERQGQSKIVAHRLKRRWTDYVRRGAQK